MVGKLTNARRECGTWIAPLGDASKGKKLQEKNDNAMEDPLEFPCRQGSGTRVIQATRSNQAHALNARSSRSHYHHQYSRSRRRRGVHTPRCLCRSGWMRVAPSGVVADGGGYAQANRSAAGTPVGAHNESQSSLRFGAVCEQAATAATTRRSSAHGSTGGVSLFAALSSARASLEAAKQETLQMQVQGMGEQYISRARLLRRSSHAIDEYRSTRMECGMRTSNLAWSPVQRPIRAILERTGRVRIDKTYDATFHLRRHAVSTTRTHTDTSPLPRCHLHDLLSQCTPSLHQN